MRNLAIAYLWKTVRQHPHKDAIVDHGRTISFARLWRHALLLAAGIRARTSSSVIVVSIPKSIETIVAFAGAQLAGAVYVPLDPATPTERQRRILDKLGAHEVLEWRGGHFRINGASCLPGDDGTCDLDAVETSLVRALRSRSALDPLYIMFTSGTTGIPKGVTISNQSVIDYIDWAIDEYGLDRHETIGNGVPLFFDGSVLDLYLTFALGCTLHLIPGRVLRFPADLVQYLARHRVTMILFVPSALTMLATLDQLAHASLPALRRIFFIGEPMPLDTVRYFRRRLPHATLANHYGPTEVTVAAICWTAGESLDDLTDTPIGGPCANTEVILVDDGGCVIERPDTIGEIWIGGLGVAMGYWNDPEETAARFVQNPRHTHYRDIVYRTGDLGYRSSKDGLYYMTGRKDHQFKHMGHRIEPGEIESALMRIRGIAQCSVQYDSRRKHIVAFLLGPAPPSLAGLRGLLADAIPSYMMPQRVVTLDRFPLTPHGKIDRKALQREWMQ